MAPIRYHKTSERKDGYLHPLSLLDIRSKKRFSRLVNLKNKTQAETYMIHLYALILHLFNRKETISGGCS